MKLLSNYSDRQIKEMTMKILGWINFPSDSVENGDTWYSDPETAPFKCEVKTIWEWDPLGTNSDALRLALELGMVIQMPRCETGLGNIVVDLYDHSSIALVKDHTRNSELASKYNALRYAIVECSIKKYLNDLKGINNG